MCELGLLFGHKLSHLKFEIHVDMHLSQRRLQTRCRNTNSSSQMRWILKGMAGGTLIGLLHVTTYSRFVSGLRDIYPLS